VKFDTRLVSGRERHAFCVVSEPSEKTEHGNKKCRKVRRSLKCESIFHHLGHDGDYEIWYTDDNVVAISC
jgi:hypothetical protein